MKPCRRRTPLQRPSQSQKPPPPSRRKSGPLQRKNRRPAPHPPIPKRLLRQNKSSSLPTTKSVSAPTSSPSAGTSFRSPAIPTTIGSKPAASSSKKRSANALGGARPCRAAAPFHCANVHSNRASAIENRAHDIRDSRISFHRHLPTTIYRLRGVIKGLRPSRSPANIPSPSRSAD